MPRLEQSFCLFGTNCVWLPGSGSGVWDRALGSGTQYRGYVIWGAGHCCLDLMLKFVPWFDLPCLLSFLQDV